MTRQIPGMEIRCPKRWTQAQRARVFRIALSMRDSWERFATLNTYHAQHGFILAKRQRGEYIVKLCYADLNSGSYVPVCSAYEPAP